MTQLVDSLSIEPGRTVARLRGLLFVAANRALVSGEDKTAFTSVQLQQETSGVWADVGTPLSVFSDGTDDEDSIVSGTIINHLENCYSVDITISAVTGERVRIKVTPSDGDNIFIGTHYQINRLPDTNSSGEVVTDLASRNASKATGYSTHSPADVRTEFAPELGRIDENVSDAKLLTSAYDRAKNAASAAELTASEGTIVAAVQAVNTGAARHIAILTANAYEVPDTGTEQYGIEIRTYDGDGEPVAIDSAADPTVTIKQIDGTDLSSDLSAITNPATGVYRLTYDVDAGDTVQPLVIEASGLISATLRSTAAYPVVADAVSVDFTATDRANLVSIAGKLPSSDYLLGGTSSDGTGYATSAEVSAIDTKLGTPATNVSTDIAAVKTDTGNLLTRIPAALFAGITSLAAWLGLLAGKSADAGTLAEVQATTGGATYDNTSDSPEAIRDRGDTSWAGDSASTIYTYFVTGSNADPFKSTGFATPGNVTSAQTAIVTEINANEAKIDTLQGTATKLETALEDDGASGWRFTTLAMANAPAGGGGGSLGEGARTVAINVTLDGDDLQTALVRVTKGVLSHIGMTDTDGQITFNLDDGDWTVAITHPLGSFAGAELSVAADVSQPYAMTANTQPSSDDPAMTVVWTYLKLGSQVIQGAKLYSLPAEDNMTLSASVVSQAKDLTYTNADGYAQIEIPKASSLSSGSQFRIVLEKDNVTHFDKVVDASDASSVWLGSL